MDELAGTSPGFRRFEIACILVYPFSWLSLLARTWTTLSSLADFVLAFVIGVLTADFISGIFHWFFDTWFSPTTPFIGSSFVRTFREHHVDPQAICRHDFVETNGSNIFAGSVLVIAGHCADAVVGEALGAFAAASLLFASVFMSLTSQIHKWAHADHVPRVVGWAQTIRLILPPRAHALHHDAPFDREYCITSGWLNGALTQLRFFRTIERVVEALTGAVPRCDDVASRPSIEGP